MRICLLNAHPDADPARFCHAVADAYEQGALKAGHTVDRFDLGALPVAVLQSAEDFKAPPAEPVRQVQAALSAADHFVMVYPLWLGALPAAAKAFLEQLARADFLIETAAQNQTWPAQKMKGKSARLIVTMGMPGFAYRLFYRSHSLKGLETGVLRLAGFAPVRDSVFGGVETTPERRAKLLETARALGVKGR
ncbi:MAG: NAD(P)H-dependent oxidoreductase [Oceanicaulis sp.]